MITPSTYPPSIGSQFPLSPILESVPVAPKGSSFLTDISSPESFSLDSSSRMNSDEALRSLFDIIKNRDLTPTEKNIRFAQQLAKIQLTTTLRLRLHTQFTTNQLTFRLCSANTFLPRETEDVENASMPFCVLKPLYGSQEASDLIEVPRLNFHSIVFPQAVHAQINSNEVYKKKAEVESIRTLQEWAHGFTHSLDLPLPDPMPQITGDFYKVAAFMPVTIEREQNVTHWNPFVRGETGPKMLFSYSASDQIEGSHARATPGMSRRNNYIPMQDIAESNLNWTNDSLAFEDTEQSKVIAKIKRATVNFAVLPVHPIDPYPRVISSPPRTARNSTVAQSPVTYGTYNATGRHRVESQSAVLLQISPVPIDVTRIETQEALAKYLQGLTGIVRRLEIPDSQPLDRIDRRSEVSVQPRVLSPRRARGAPVKNLMQTIGEGILHLTNWITDLFSSFLLALRER